MSPARGLPPGLLPEVDPLRQWEPEPPPEDGYEVVQIFHYGSGAAEFVDEVQDMTQGELALLLQLSGLRHDRLLLAGDTAQSISYGVDFRFDEVRSVVHALCGGAVAPKPLTLSQNYRSHAGVLDIAAKVVDVMHAAFPHAADVLPRDVGLAQARRACARRLGYLLRCARRLGHPLRRRRPATA